MRIKLTEEATQALQAMIKEIHSSNPYIEQDNSRLISAIVVTLQRHMQPRFRDELLQAVSTPESARLALMRDVETLSQGLDVDSIRALGSTMRKLKAQASGARKAEEIEPG